LPAIGLDLYVRLSRESCSDGLTLIEARSAPGFGPPLHRRVGAQTCYVLSGRFQYEIDGNRFVAETGAAFEVPGGAQHAFLNLSDKPSSQLLMMQPGFDAHACFAELQALLAPELTDPQKLWLFERRWGIEFVGPPLPAPSSGRAPNRRHTAEFKAELCRSIRAGTIGRREAQKRYSLSDNLIHLWLARYDRDEREPAGAAT
jgi:mannose-6-phosphate isomerase-like protein (cupin superfamily)